MNNKFYETRVGFEAIRDKLKKFEHDLAHAIPEALATAAAFGDRSENAEYDEAQRWQRDSQKECEELKKYLASVVMVEKQPQYNHVAIGSLVKLLENDKNEKIYSIVGKYQADASQGMIFYGSPLARSILNAKVGEEIEFKAPNGVMHNYKILEITPYE